MSKRMLWFSRKLLCNSICEIFKILAVLVLIDSLLIAITLLTIQKRITHYFHLFIYLLFIYYFIYIITGLYL